LVCFTAEHLHGYKPKISVSFTCNLTRKLIKFYINTFNIFTSFWLPRNCLKSATFSVNVTNLPGNAEADRRPAWIRFAKVCIWKKHVINDFHLPLTSATEHTSSIHHYFRFRSTNPLFLSYSRFGRIQCRSFGKCCSRFESGCALYMSSSRAERTTASQM